MSHKANDLYLEDLQEKVESNEDQEQVHITLGDLPRLRESYAQAQKAGADMFQFEVQGKKRDILTAYAKYLIEYLDYVSKIRGTYER